MLSGWRCGSLSPLFVAAVSGCGIGYMFACRVSRCCIYDSDDVATLPAQDGSIPQRPTNLFAKGARGRSWLLTSFSLPLVPPVVPTSNNTTHVTAHTSPSGGLPLGSIPDGTDVPAPEVPPQVQQHFAGPHNYVSSIPDGTDPPAPSPPPKSSNILQGPTIT